MSSPTTWIGLLRGVNVGGNKKVPMAELLAMLAGLGLREPRTLLQSGNALFAAREGDRAKLRTALESATRERFGFDVPWLLRSAAEWRALVAANPFPDAARADPSKLLLFALSAAPEADAVAALAADLPGGERVCAIGSELYVFYPSGIGGSKLDNARIDRRLRLISTGRNWNTVLKLARLLPEADG